MTLSAPRLLAGLALVPGNQVELTYLGPMLSGRPQRPSPDELQIWRSSRENALGWLDLPDAWSDLSLIDMLEAQDTTDRGVQVAHYRDARDEVIASLRLNPSDGFMWLRLAQLDARLGKVDQVVLRSVMHSIETAPYEPGAIFLRVALGFRSWTWASEDEKRLLLEQVAMIPEASQWRDLDRLIAEFPERIPELRQALSGSEQALARLDEAQSAED